MDKGKVILKKEFIEKISTLFLTKDPVAEIHHELKKMIEDGYDRDQMHQLLSEYRIDLQNQGKEKEEDIIVDLLTFFIGWSHQDWQL